MNEIINSCVKRKRLRRIAAWLAVLCLTFAFSTASAASVPENGEKILTVADADRTFEKGLRADINGIAVVSLYGTWHEMGRQYGMLMKDRLDEVFFFVNTIIEYSVGNAEKARSIIAVQTAQTPYRIREFFEGAAETSGLTVEQLQAVNAVERIGGLPKCSAAFCWGEYTAGPLVIGRNYDYSEAFWQLKDDVAVTVYHPADGSLATATIGYAGEIYAVNAINEKYIHHASVASILSKLGMDAEGMCRMIGEDCR